MRHVGMRIWPRISWRSDIRRVRAGHWPALESLFILVPWSLFILYAAWPMTMQSVRQLESFPETFNPGYFMLKIALLLATVLVLVQALLDAFRGRARHERAMSETAGIGMLFAVALLLIVTGLPAWQVLIGVAL